MTNNKKEAIRNCPVKRKGKKNELQEKEENKEDIIGKNSKIMTR